MEDNRFEKRMIEMKKSYERVPSSFDSDEILRKIENDSIKHIPNKPNTMRKNITVWAMSIASVFLIGFLAATFLLTENRDVATMTEKEITDQFRLELEQSYKEEREKRQEILKMADELFNRLPFVTIADERYNQHSNKSADKKELEMGFEKAVEALKLPSEMIAELLRNPLSKDEKASNDFAVDYQTKINDLIVVYDEALVEMDKENTQIPRSQFNKMVDVMKHQNIKYLDDSPYMEFTKAIYNLPENDREIRKSLHINVQEQLDNMAEYQLNDFGAQFAFESRIYSIEGNVTRADRILTEIGTIEEIVEEITGNGQGKLFSSAVKVNLVAGTKIYRIEDLDIDTIVAVEIDGLYYTAIYTRKLN